MEQLENIIIFILILAVAYFYFKDKKELFTINFPDYYPITTEVNPKFNNYNNSIEDKRLDVLSNALESVRKDSNKKDEFKEFNLINLPVIKKTLELNDVKPLVDFLLKKINSKFDNSYNLILSNVKDIHKTETESESKINFRMICQFKIKTNSIIEYIRPNPINKEDNQLIILVEIISSKEYDNESIHINYIQISGLTGTNFLPGQNYYNNHSNFLISDFDTKKIIEDKENLNSKEVNDYNLNIDEDINLNDITIDESNDDSLINTEEAESFFNL